MRKVPNELTNFLAVAALIRLVKAAKPMLRLTFTIVLVVSTLVSGLLAQADYEAGQRAWDAGRHSEALREWQASANASDAKAMMALGRLYRQGLGAPQDYVKAHMWFNLAASRGEMKAVTDRDALAARMAPEQIAKAQERAAAWRPQSATAPDASAASGTAAPPPKAIREAQELLAALGYEPDHPDGQWGELTAHAYQAFVRDANLPMTDTLTPVALSAMRDKARKAGAESVPKTELPPYALHRAANAGNLKGLQAALAAGADVNERDDKGWTALMYAVDKGYVLLVEPLLQGQADPDVRAPEGATALFIAVAHGHSEIIPMLMKAGADPTIKGPKAKTVTEVAKARYGEPEEARKKGESDAVIALLKGQTWEQADEKAFARARFQGTAEAYAEYLSVFSAGLHADEARDAEAFSRADALWTVEAYAEYIASYPTGRHVEQAQRWQAALNKESLLTAASPAGTTMRECDECPEMVVVPAGRFQMGAVNPGWREERPVHEVTIKHPFAVGRYEVTFAEWDTCVAGGGCTHTPDDEGWGRGTRPVINVSWHDAKQYVHWLARETGKPYRLLSEAEWEYVARAGTTTRYWWGGWFNDEVDHDYANHEGTAGEDRWVNTSPVGSFKANAFGLFDTAGNVCEWVEDRWHNSYEGAPNDGSAWTICHDSCSLGVVRGGAWITISGDGSRKLMSHMIAGRRGGLRSADRDMKNRSSARNTLGFRVARTLTS